MAGYYLAVCLLEELGRVDPAAKARVLAEVFTNLENKIEDAPNGNASRILDFMSTLRNG